MTLEPTQLSAGIVLTEDEKMFVISIQNTQMKYSQSWFDYKSLWFFLDNILIVRVYAEFVPWL